MNEKSIKITSRVLTVLIAFVFLGSATGKFIGDEEALQMASGFGLDSRTYTALGVLELICLLIFVLPKTGVLGGFLLAAYMGGAIATHLAHGKSLVAPCVIEFLIILSSFVRYSELRIALFNTKP